jgi:proline iminopeptidase
MMSATGDRSPSGHEGYAQVNGVSHFYRMIGEGEPFVVLHGGPGMWHDELFPFFGDLASDHQVVFYDQRGNGKSLMAKITPETFTVDWLVADLEELRKVWGFDRINIVGHSWGGLLAMYYATEHAHRLERLILIDPAPVNTALLIRSYQVLRGRFADDEWAHLQRLYESEPYLAGDPSSHNEALRLSEGATFHVAEARDRYFDLVAFDATTARNMVAISGPAHAMKLNITVQDKLAAIDCPTLIVHGEHDFIVAAAPELLHQLISDSELVVIPDSGHYPFIEQPAIFGETLRRFIARRISTTGRGHKQPRRNLRCGGFP